MARRRAVIGMVEQIQRALTVTEPLVCRQGAERLFGRVVVGGIGMGEAAVRAAVT